MKYIIAFILVLSFYSQIKAQCNSIPFEGYTHALVIGKEYNLKIPLIVDNCHVWSYKTGDSVDSDSPYNLIISTKGCSNWKLPLFKDYFTYTFIQVGDSIIIDNHIYRSIYRRIDTDDLYDNIMPFVDAIYKIVGKQ
jgi:hypothetical protein